MTPEIVLLLLRVLSAAALFLLLISLFIIIWRDYRSVVTGVDASRRIYGQLVAMQEIGGKLIITGEAYPMLQLTTLGRAPTNTITVDDSFASGDHALLALRDGQWWLEDRKSRNGTLLNETPLQQPTVVTDGDIIGIGQLRFRIELTP